MRNALLLALVAVLVVAACTGAIEPGTPGKGSGLRMPGTGSATQEFKTFEDKQEIIEYLQANQGQNNGYYGGMMRGTIMMETMEAAMDSATGISARTAAMGGAKAVGGADEYSTTNVQVAGVDEADFVKNDGEYIYVISGDQLVIARAYPAEDAEIVSKTHIEGHPQQIFLNGDTVVVFTQQDDQRMVWPQYGVLPQPRYATSTYVQVYDVSDREEPELVKEYSVSGSYAQSRMIGSSIYLVTNDYVYYTTTYIDIPVVREDGDVVVSPRVAYFDNPEQNYQFTTVASFDLAGGQVDAETYLMGYANTVYMSKDSLYIAYQKNVPWRSDDRERFFDAVVPLLPTALRGEIERINSGSGSEAEKWDLIAGKLEELFNAMDDEEKEALMGDINDAVEEYEFKRAAERSRTVIHRIAADGGKLDYKARGEVPGTLLNQFSLDERDGMLRVATTTDIWTRQRTQYNNVYVLDDGLDVVGKLEEIAPDERIYSTRFLGDRLYMVTFKQIDPFFVIDLSNPRHPSVLGELKIPGWSNYLHPYDEDHVIGIGKDTGENEYGQVSVKGLKLALFDVSDVSNPKQVDMVKIGDTGSDSEALNDHKAFLFDKKTGLLVIPVREVSENRGWDSRHGYWQQHVWQGAYVFTVKDSGFEKRGKVQHYDGEDNWWYGNAVRRSLFMDDVLSTVSNGKIVLSDLDTLKKLGEIDLPGFDNWYPRPMTIDVMGRVTVGSTEAVPAVEVVAPEVVRTEP